MRISHVNNQAASAYRVPSRLKGCFNEFYSFKKADWAIAFWIIMTHLNRTSIWEFSVTSPSPQHSNDFNLLRLKRHFFILFRNFWFGSKFCRFPLIFYNKLRNCKSASQVWNSSELISIGNCQLRFRIH